MKLIIERVEGEYYVYAESEEHHKVVEEKQQRPGKKISHKVLSDECCLDRNDEIPFDEDFYMVLDLMEW